jgi:hypothetical protein
VANTWQYVIAGVPYDTYDDETWAGSACIFEKPTGGWVSTTKETERVLNPDAFGERGGDRFGSAVTIDETNAIVGASWDDNAADCGSAGGQVRVPTEQECRCHIQDFMQTECYQDTLLNWYPFSLDPADSADMSAWSVMDCDIPGGRYFWASGGDTAYISQRVLVAHEGATSRDVSRCWHCVVPGFYNIKLKGHVCRDSTTIELTHWRGGSIIGTLLKGHYNHCDEINETWWWRYLDYCDWINLRVNSGGLLEFREGYEEYFCILVSGTSSTDIELARFDALPGKDYIDVVWETASEVSNAGFNVYRSISPDGHKLKISKDLIAAKGDELKGAAYSFTDRKLARGLTYYYWLEDVNLTGVATTHGPVSARVGPTATRPKMFSLAQNIPNPFQGVTEIGYGLPIACDVRLAVYNVMGQKVRTLVREHLTAGFRSVQWDGKNDRGEEVPGGVYYYKLEAGEYTEFKRMILLR